MTNWPRQGVRMMTRAAVLGTALIAILVMAPSAWGAPTEMAMIETRAVLDNDSDDGIDAALKQALERAILRVREELREGPHVIGWALGLAASTDTRARTAGGRTLSR